MIKLLHILTFLFAPVYCFGQLATSPEVVAQSLGEHIRYNSEGANSVGYLYIGDHKQQINQGTWVYVKNALDHYKETRPAFIILQLDTPGGQLYPSQKIATALREMDTQHGIPIVALIDDWAISAGAMLAYSCRYIAVVKSGSMGAAQPITTKGETTSEKVNSAVRADFANRAAFFDRNPLIAEAMVDPDLILVLRTGKIMQLHKEDQIEPTDQVLSNKGKLLTLNSKQLIELGVADIPLSATKLAPITAEERTSGQWPLSKSPLSAYPSFKDIPNATVHAFKMDWKVRFFTLLASPLVTSALFLGLMVCMYLEINTPGFGLAGSIGIGCLLLLVLSSFAVEAAGWLEVIILGVGIALILIELFVIPGFGVVGILGILLTLVGLGLLLLPSLKEVTFDFDTNTLNAAGQFVLQRLAWLAGTLVVGILIIALLARYLVPKIGLFSPLILRGEQEGYVAGPEAGTLPPPGATGVVVAPLRTAGKVEIDGELYDAVSSGAFLDKGTPVKVLAIEGSKMIVEEVT